MMDSVCQISPVDMMSTRDLRGLVMSMSIALEAREPRRTAVRADPHGWRVENLMVGQVEVSRLGKERFEECTSR
jgi:hypothetical protein